MNDFENATPAFGQLLGKFRLYSFPLLNRRRHNHTVFLASVFKPNKYLAVDVDLRSIEETQANAVLNRANYPNTYFIFKNSALGAIGGLEVEISGKKTYTKTLEELLPLDLDWMEGDLLNPLLEFLKDKNVRICIEVESQYLNDYEKKMRDIGYRVTHRTDHGNYANLFFQRSD